MRNSIVLRMLTIRIIYRWNWLNLYITTGGCALRLVIHGGGNLHTCMHKLSIMIQNSQILVIVMLTCQQIIFHILNQIWKYRVGAIQMYMYVISTNSITFITSMISQERIKMYIQESTVSKRACSTIVFRKEL
jgi:hypothetical protein